MSVVEATGPIKFAPISATSGGDTTILSAVSGKRLRILALTLTAASNAELTLKSASTAISGALAVAANWGFSASAPWGIAETDPGEALVLNLDGANTIGGMVSYQEL